jgi:glycogen debranching enzyme
MSSYCINGISEICDGNIPFMSKGCASQAWSVAEVLRAYYEIVLRKQF